MTHQTISITTPAHQSMVEITREVNANISKLGVDDGVVHLFVEHTTCGLFINENADPDVVGDLLRRFEKLVPWHDPADRHAEGNTAAHLRSIMTGCSLTIPVAQGRLLLGTWQGIYLAEFDGPRTRRAVISTLK
ncbi:secondary thiamine-phosphate synthase enzyme YjbQ [Candidatus Reidiella endopervernicosa]|uniref:YjbQ family protein n=1 Tax=Candidatus Reidiella endopervernicosa TaxID=2738883 RepID=A0A6N0HYT0_9GAMM|nr:secondary thiamine-phosphate synthase enzyme YjbQ [Candidatus Reidiella endopervernicosa]QKQ27427.1 YjbQ family protein [Candidatus Reidiella endopervernicosa]